MNDQLVKYEWEVIEMLLRNKLNKVQIESIKNSIIRDMDCTGAGYYLTIESDALPVERQVFAEPLIYGKGDRCEVGFIIFIENKVLVFECHTWGIGKLPQTVRNKPITIKELEF